MPTACLAWRAGWVRHERPVRAVIESMTGARFVHDRLEALGWDVLIADAAKSSKAWRHWRARPTRSTRACSQCCRIATWCPRSGCPIRSVRREREQARFRMHLVKHRSMLKHRIHATLISFGHPCPVRDLFGVAGRELLDRLDVPQPWRGNVDASLHLIDDLDRQIDAINRELRRAGADHPYVPLLLTVPGIGWVLGVHDRRRDRRHPPLRVTHQAVRLHRPVPARLPVRGPRQPRPADQAGTEVPALGDARSDHARPAHTRPIASATSATSAAWAASAAPRSLRSTSPASSPKRSGTCSPTTSPSLPPREAPLFVWPLDGPCWT